MLCPGSPAPVWVGGDGTMAVGVGAVPANVVMVPLQSCAEMVISVSAPMSAGLVGCGPWLGSTK